VKWVALLTSLTTVWLAYTLIQVLGWVDGRVQIAAHASYYAGCVEAGGKMCLPRAWDHAHNFLRVEK